MLFLNKFISHILIVVFSLIYWKDAPVKLDFSCLDKNVSQKKNVVVKSATSITRYFILTVCINFTTKQKVVFP